MAREYTPNAGSQADRIHKALARLGSADVDELARACGLSRKRIQTEVWWALNRAEGAVFRALPGERYTHTGLYVPRPS
jgi:hypothetical protein